VGVQFLDEFWSKTFCVFGANWGPHATVEWPRGTFKIQQGPAKYFNTPGIPPQAGVRRIYILKTPCGVPPPHPKEPALWCRRLRQGFVRFAQRRSVLHLLDMCVCICIYICMYTHRLFQIDAQPDRVSLRFCSGLVLARTDAEQFCNTSLAIRARPDLESLVEVSAAPARHVCMYMQHLGQSMFEIGRRQCWGPRCSQELARTCTQIPACPAPPEGGAAEHIYVYIHTYIHT
jgi:hypothetical protein